MGTKADEATTLKTKWNWQSHTGPSGRLDWGHFIGHRLLFELDDWLIFDCGCAIRPTNCSDHTDMRSHHETLKCLTSVQEKADQTAGRMERINAILDGAP